MEGMRLNLTSDLRNIASKYSLKDNVILDHAVAITVSNMIKGGNLGVTLTKLGSGGSEEESILLDAIILCIKDLPDGVKLINEVSRSISSITGKSIPIGGTYDKNLEILSGGGKEEEQDSIEHDLDSLIADVKKYHIEVIAKRAWKNIKCPIKTEFTDSDGRFSYKKEMLIPALQHSLICYLSTDVVTDGINFIENPANNEAFLGLKLNRVIEKAGLCFGSTSEIPDVPSLKTFGKIPEYMRSKYSRLFEQGREYDYNDLRNICAVKEYLMKGGIKETYADYLS